jgi:hypothetical protein
MKKVKRRVSQKAKEVPINENLLYAERNIWSPMYKGLYRLGNKMAVS